MKTTVAKFIISKIQEAELIECISLLKMLEDRISAHHKSQQIYLVLLLFSAFLLETTFEISKVSFLSRLSIKEVFLIMVNSIALAVILLLPVLILIQRLTSMFTLKNLFLYLIYLVLTFILVIVSFVHIDTFLYSAFQIDITDLSPLFHKITLFLMLTSSLLISFLLLKNWHKGLLRFKRTTSVVVLIILSVFVTSSLYRAYITSSWSVKVNISETKAKKYPNIVLFSTDGLNASHMSLYGYHRKTTPIIDRFASESIVYTRAYSNAGNTRGSVISILTGKHPLTTMLLYPPDILMGKDSFEHLPAILSSIGYYWIDIGDGIYTSPRQCNLVGGINNENGYDRKTGEWFITLKKLFNLEVYFISHMLSRYLDKISFLLGKSQRLLYFKQMIHGIETEYLTDEKRLEIALNKIREKREPFFLHIHMMKTHGPKFRNPKKRYAKDKKIIEDWDIDVYDDAIYTMDSYFGEILTTLKREGLYENTLIIFHTDHGFKWDTLSALPLIVHLPGQKDQIIVDQPVQYLDITPSILNYIGVDIPEWMEGKPIFPIKNLKEIKKQRAFIIVETRGVYDRKAKAWVKPYIGPPYYGLTTIALLKDNYIYKVYLETSETVLYNIENPLRPLRAETNRGTRGEYKKELEFLLKSYKIDLKLIPK